MSKLGSLFDGSGGFPLAGTLCDIEPVWASEIEPFPMRVTAKRFPNMKQLGDVTKINGAEIEPVDIITFGSPCQDLSVAGRQAGIHEGTRSCLFFEAVRIIKEMRHATSDKYPRFAVWENVPGAFSSNNGKDFLAVLQALCEIKEPNVFIPEPEKGRLGHAGSIVGDGYSIAWRVYDAQFWGVPQRRKRIYLIADFASERAGKILFESESVSGNTEQSGETGQSPSGDAEGSAGRSDKAFRFIGNMGAKAGNIGYGDVSPTLKAGQESHVVYCCLNDQGVSVMDVSDKAMTLRAQEHGHQPIICFEPGIAKREGSEGRFVEDKTPTLRANMGDNQPAVCYGIENHPNDSRVRLQEPDEPCQSLTSRMGTGGGNVPMILQEVKVVSFTQGSYGEYRTDGKASTLMARDFKQAQGVAIPQPGRKYIVRRLTPLECCRLQGFPDWWTDGVEGSDSALYKMWGNGIALPCALDVMQRIAKEIDGREPVRIVFQETQLPSKVQTESGLCATHEEAEPQNQTG